MIALDDEYEPILCRCRPWRNGLMADHIDHHATYERERRAGRVLDEVWAEAIAIEPFLRIDQNATSAI